MQDQKKTSMNLKRRSAVGVAWLASASFIGSACQFIAVAVFLGRELSTENFARIAALGVAMNLCFILSRLGLGNALIQRAKLSDKDINAVFWVALANALLVGAGLAVFALVGAGRLFWLDLRPYMLGMAAVVVAYGAGLAPRNLLLRDMRYRDASIAEGFASLMFALVAIVVVYIRPTLLSILAAFFARQTTDTILCFYLSRWRPSRPSFIGKPLREMVRFGSCLTASETVNFAGANATVPIIGGMLGDGPLGMFDMANRIVVFPMNRVIGIMARVLLPVFSRAQDDNARMRRGYCLLIRYQAMIACPAMVGLILVAPELVSALLHPKWAESTLLIQLRCPYGLFIVLSRPLMDRNDPLAATAVIFLFGSLGMLIYGADNLAAADLGALSTRAVVAMVFAVLGATVLTYFLNYWALKRTQASHVALYIFLQPVVAALLGIWLMGDEVTPRFLIATVLVFLALFRREKRRRNDTAS